MAKADTWSSINLVKIKIYAPFVLLGIILLVEVLSLAFHFPKKAFELWDLKNRLTVLSDEVKSLSSAQQQLGAVEASLLSSYLKLAEVALPDEKKVAGLISGLVSVASSSGVTVKAVSFSPGRISVSTVSAGVAGEGAGEVEIGDKVRAIPVTMTVASSLAQFLDYLERLQAASQLLGVTGINYSLSEQSSGDLNLIVYYLPERLGKPGWQYIPSISAEDLKMLTNLSPRDIFNLPSGLR